MISILHRSLICLLVLLQLVTPLVHAHSGQEESRDGFHLPGLEFITAIEKGVDLARIFLPSQHDGTIVSVSSGIQQKKLSNNCIKQYFIISDGYLNQPGIESEVLVLPENFTNLIHFYLHTGFPRAPPNFSI